MVNHTLVSTVRCRDGANHPFLLAAVEQGNMLVRANARKTDVIRRLRSRMEAFIVLLSPLKKNMYTLSVQLAIPPVKHFRTHRLHRVCVRFVGKVAHAENGCP